MALCLQCPQGGSCIANTLMSRCLSCRGYNTQEERRRAQHMSGVQLLSLTGFCELLRWGIIMGVDDGCEPTMEEVAAGVAH